MKKALAALFASEIVASHDVGKLEEGTKTPITMVLEAARGLMTSYKDVPKAVHEAVDGFIVSGDRHAFLFSDTGEVTHAEVPATDEDEKTGEVAVLDEVSDGAAASILMKLKTALDGKNIEEAKKLLARLKATEKIAAGGKVTTTRVADESKKVEEPGLNMVLARTLAAKRPTAPPEKLAAAVEAATKAIAAALSETADDQPKILESLNEVSLYTSTSPTCDSYGGSSCIKIDTVTASVYGGSLRFVPGDFIKEAPGYAIADFVMEKAILSVLGGDTGEALVAAIKAALKSSDKTKALEIELRESVDATATALTEGAKAKPGEKPAANPAKAAALTEDSVAVLVLGSKTLELREGADGKGKVVVSVTCDPTDEADVARAEAEIDEKAKEAGYEHVDGDVVESAEAFVVGLMLADPTLLESRALAAFEEAKAAKDQDRLAEIVEMLASGRTGLAAETAALCEGLRTKARSPGRKPSGKTMVRKASQAPKLPVDVGPGARFGGRVGGQADAGTVSTTPAPTASNPASSQGDASRNNSDPDDLEEAKGKVPPAFLKNIKKKKDADDEEDDADDETDDEDDDDVEEGWADDVRKMSVEEFTSHMLNVASSDKPAKFGKRVAALSEAYATGPGKKDIARKITTVNPIIKRVTGKGVDLEAVANAAANEHVVIEFPRARLDEFLIAGRDAGITNESEVRVDRNQVHVKLPKGMASKVLALFRGDDVQSAPAG